MTDVSPTLVRFIGVSELLGAIGLIIPAAIRVRPSLTGYAALGLSVVMVLALLFHVTRGENSQIGPNLFLGAVAAFIAWGRIKKAPIYPKARKVFSAVSRNSEKRIADTENN